MPSVEAEGELVEVVRQMLVTDGALMCADDPPLQECRDSMDSRHEFVGKFLATLDVCDLVSIPLRTQAGANEAWLKKMLEDEDLPELRRTIADATSGGTQPAGTLTGGDPAS